MSRPPETPPPDRAEQLREARLARQSAQTAGQLRQLVDRMEALGWQPDGYDHAQLRHVADSIHGMGLRAAMSSGDTSLLNELTDRTWTQLPPLPEDQT